MHDADTSSRLLTWGSGGRIGSEAANNDHEGKRMSHLNFRVETRALSTPSAIRCCWLARMLMVGVTLLSLTLNTVAIYAQDAWSTDAEAAVKQAADEKKDLLVLFTGSDWCPPCIKLEQQVLGTEEFAQQSASRFVLLKLDFPQNTPQSEELQKQNGAWADRFGVEGFPTLILLDQEQRPYAFTGFREEGPDAYLSHLSEFQQSRVQRDGLLQQAAKAEGNERAVLLDQALSLMDASVVELYYPELVNEIGELDKNDESGLRTKYFAERDREIRKAVMSNISMVARLREPEQAIAFIDETLEQHRLPVELRLVAMQTKLKLLRQIKKAEQANVLIDAMITLEGISPESQQRLLVNKAFYQASLGEADAAIAELDQQIVQRKDNLWLMVGKGELLDSMAEYDKALVSYDQAIMAASSEPTVLVEIIGAKADALVAMKRVDDAYQTLDALIQNETVPGKLRAEVLLHKALLLRENDRRRAAMLAENKAVETVESPEEKAEMQKLVDQFRRKFDSEDQ